MTAYNVSDAIKKGAFVLVHMGVHQNLLLTSSSSEFCTYPPTEACSLHLLPLPLVTPSHSLCRLGGPIWPLPALPPRQRPALFQRWRGVDQHQRRREEQSEGMFSPFHSPLPPQLCVYTLSFLPQKWTQILWHGVQVTRLVYSFFHT